MSLENWAVGTTKKFSGTISLNGSAPDISGDTVTLRLKTNKDAADLDAVLTKTADVATQGSDGIYEFTIDPADTSAVDPGTYHYDIEWVRSAGEEYILDTGRLSLLSRVSDTP